MTVLHSLLLVGLLSQVALGFVFAVVWRGLRERWAALLSLGFAANAAMYGAMLTSLGEAALHAPPPTASGVAAVLGIVLITGALVDYVSLPIKLARRVNALSISLAVIATVLGVAGLLSRAVGFVVMASYVMGWVVLFVGAARRERHSGHGLVIVALMAYPMTVVAVVAGLVAPELLRAAGVLPFSILGLTLLTTGLLRAHRQAADSQRALHKINETLEQEVNLRTADLHDTIEGLDSFSRNVAHDLRGPLGGIAGVAQIAREHLTAGDAGRANAMLVAIEDQARTSVRLVEALLALARASDGVLTMADVDSGRLIGDVARVLPRGDTPIELVVAPAMPIVRADPHLLRQVFANLIGNAFKFVQSSQTPRVEVTASIEAQDVVFMVRDNGAGFDPDQAGQLFKPFQRLHGESHDGFGVGLSIVKRIVERHGGRIWAEGQQGRGASFFFTLGRAG